MICPYCGCENRNDATFCSRCGNSLNNYSSYNRANNSPHPAQTSSSNNNMIIICVAIIAIVLIAAGAFVFLNMNNNGNEVNTVSNVASENTAADVGESAAQPTTSMEIISGSITTGSSLSDKTHCTVYVGAEHAGEHVKISTLYSRDGSDLNDGKIVSKTVDSSGYVSVASAYAFKYYPDFATITLYDSNGNVLDTQKVSMSASSGTQTF